MTGERSRGWPSSPRADSLPGTAQRSSERDEIASEADAISGAMPVSRELKEMRTASVRPEAPFEVTSKDGQGVAPTGGRSVRPSGYNPATARPAGAGAFTSRATRDPSVGQRPIDAGAAASAAKQPPATRLGASAPLSGATSAPLSGASSAPLSGASSAFSAGASTGASVSSSSRSTAMGAGAFGKQPLPRGINSSAMGSPATRPSGGVTGAFGGSATGGGAASSASVGRSARQSTPVGELGVPGVVSGASRGVGSAARASLGRSLTPEGTAPVGRGFGSSEADKPVADAFGSARPAPSGFASSMAKRGAPVGAAPVSSGASAAGAAARRRAPTGAFVRPDLVAPQSGSSAKAVSGMPRAATGASASAPAVPAKVGLTVGVGELDALLGDERDVALRDDPSWGALHADEASSPATVVPSRVSGAAPQKTLPTSVPPPPAPLDLESELDLPGLPAALEPRAGSIAPGMFSVDSAPPTPWGDPSAVGYGDRAHGGLSGLAARAPEPPAPMGGGAVGSWRPSSLAHVNVGPTMPPEPENQGRLWRWGGALLLSVATFALGYFAFSQFGALKVGAGATSQVVPAQPATAVPVPADPQPAPSVGRTVAELEAELLERLHAAQGLGVAVTTCDEHACVTAPTTVLFPHGDAELSPIGSNLAAQVGELAASTTGARVYLGVPQQIDELADRFKATPDVLVPLRAVQLAEALEGAGLDADRVVRGAEVLKGEAVAGKMTQLEIRLPVQGAAVGEAVHGAEAL